MMTSMRTTLNIDDDVLEQLKREAKRGRTSLRAITNRVLRLGLDRVRPEGVRAPYESPTFAMGFPPVVNLDKALQLAALLEDEETIRKLAVRK
jgi:hypothetical protein